MGQSGHYLLTVGLGQSGQYLLTIQSGYISFKTNVRNVLMALFRYIERIAVVSSRTNDVTPSSQEVVEWMHKIQQWNPKFFTLAHVPEKYRLTVTKFIRRVVISRMAETPEMAAAYHHKLREAYETEDKLKNKTVIKQSTDHLVRLLDEIESKLGETAFLAGEEFTMADAVFIPVLARLELLKVADEYIGSSSSRPNIAEYWMLVQQRPSYKKVIGKYFKGWRKHKTLMKTWCFLHIRTLLRRY